MYIYQDKNSLFCKIHPITLLLYVFVLSFISLLFSHPIFLFCLLISVTMLIFVSGIFREWLGYMKVSLGFILMIIFVNVIFVRLGATVLMRGPYLPGIGGIRITLESLLYGLTMGIRFLIIMSVFCVFTYLFHPDKGLKLIGGLGSKSVLTLTISTRLFPLMISDVKRIIDVQRCRGVNFQGGSMVDKVKKYVPIVNVLLLSSLERSFQMSEALQARGYGLGRRSSYTQEIMRPRDYIIISVLFICFVGGIWLYFKGIASYAFYPRLKAIHSKEIIYAFFYSLLCTIPAFLDWGWQNCPLLKSRI